MEPVFNIFVCSNQYLDNKACHLLLQKVFRNSGNVDLDSERYGWRLQSNLDIYTSHILPKYFNFHNLSRNMNEEGF